MHEGSPSGNNPILPPFERCVRQSTSRKCRIPSPVVNKASSLFCRRFQRERSFPPLNIPATVIPAKVGVSLQVCRHTFPPEIEFPSRTRRRTRERRSPAFLSADRGNTARSTRCSGNPSMTAVHCTTPLARTSHRWLFFLFVFRLKGYHHNYRRNEKCPFEAPTKEAISFCGSRHLVGVKRNACHVRVN